MRVTVSVGGSSDVGLSVRVLDGVGSSVGVSELSSGAGSDERVICGRVAAGCDDGALTLGRAVGSVMEPPPLQAVTPRRVTASASRRAGRRRMEHCPVGEGPPRLTRFG